MGGLCSPVTQDHDYLVQLTKTDLAFSYGGNAGCNSSDSTNTLIAFNLNWTRIYSRAEIQRNKLKALETYNDYYVNQLSALAHEVGHLHGLGVGEYYSLGAIIDNTGVPPKMSPQHERPIRSLLGYERAGCSRSHVPGVYGCANHRRVYVLSSERHLDQQGCEWRDKRNYLRKSLLRADQLL
jgi:hypothetical protein